MRSIIESHGFAAEREALAPDIQRWDEAIIGLEFILSNSPAACGTLIPNSNPPIFTVAYDKYVGVALVIYYRFDATSVTLLSLTRRAADASDL